MLPSDFDSILLSLRPVVDSTEMGSYVDVSLINLSHFFFRFISSLILDLTIPLIGLVRWDIILVTFHSFLGSNRHQSHQSSTKLRVLVHQSLDFLFRTFIAFSLSCLMSLASSSARGISRLYLVMLDYGWPCLCS